MSEKDTVLKPYNPDACCGADCFAFGKNPAEPCWSDVKANARYHTAAEHFERESKHLAYVNAQLAQPSHDALFDGSDAHLLNNAGDAFEPDN